MSDQTISVETFLELEERARTLVKYTDFTFDEIMESALDEGFIFELNEEEIYQVLTKDEITAMALDPYHSSICQDDHYWIRTIRL